MIKNFIYKQSGFTLHELLAGITISTMVIGLLSSVLIMSFKHNEYTQSHINLTQEANLIMTKLRQAHQEESYNLCYYNGRIYYDSEKKDSLTSEKVTLKAIEENGVMIENGSFHISESNPDPCVLIDTSKPLLVTLTLVDEDNKEFEIDTVIDRLSPYNPGDT
ncbi:MAG: PulJ/GspJ family protein [Bacillota bacterium]